MLGGIRALEPSMTTKRKVLTAVFLILFLLGGLVALAGEVAAAFIYWFILAVVFIGLWFLLVPCASTLATVGVAPTGETTPRQPNVYKHMKIIVSGPDGMTRDYAPEELHLDFVAGTVTANWIAREKDETDWGPVQEVLYAPLFLTTPRGNWLDRGAIRYSAWMYWAHLLICQCPGFVLGLVYALGCATPEGKAVGWKLVMFCSIGVAGRDYSSNRTSELITP